MAMKKWSEESSDFLDALGGNTVNPLNQKKASQKATKAETTQSPTKEVDGGKKKITTIHIEEDIYTEFKIFSTRKKKSITDLLRAAMQDMLDGSYFPKRLKD